MKNPVASILPLQLEDLSYRVGERTIIDRITLRLEAGPRTLILGPNGAGKSVLMRLCHGLLEPTGGAVRWAAPEAAAQQAMVFQRPVMLRRSALANVEYALALRGLTGRERRARACEALEHGGLQALAERPARTLSGGEQQRLAIARAWALRPQVLFLDEPTASLDPGATLAIEALIVAIADAGTKIVMTTHNLGQARRLADEIVFIAQGRLIEQRPAGAFFDAPASPEALAFISSEVPWSRTADPGSGRG